MFKIGYYKTIRRERAQIFAIENDMLWGRVLATHRWVDRLTGKEHEFTDWQHCRWHLDGKVLKKDAFYMDLEDLAECNCPIC